MVAETNPGAEVNPGSHGHSKKDRGSCNTTQRSQRNESGPNRQVSEQQQGVDQQWLVTDRPTNADTGPNKGHKNQQTNRKAPTRRVG